MPPKIQNVKELSRIAIIGGGLSGVAVFARIVQEILKSESTIDNVAITIYDPTPVYGPGEPYNINNPETFLLNHETNDVGMLNIHNPNAGYDDFFLWIQKNLASLSTLYPNFELTNPLGYVPRSLYGRYLSERYQETLAYASHKGIFVRELHHIVEDIIKISEGFLIYYQDNEMTKTELANIVILAMGYWKEKIDSTLEKTGQYFPAYPIKKVTDAAVSLASEQAIVVLGTGLAANDVVLELLAKGINNIFMVSRHGYMRQVRGKIEPYHLCHFKKTTLDAYKDKEGYWSLDLAIELATHEMIEAYHGELPSNIRDIVIPKNIIGQLKDNIEQVLQGKPLIWRSVYTSIMEEAHELYEKLSPSDKDRFIKEYHSLYLSYLAPMPLPSAVKLYEAMEQGRLNVLGGLKKVEWSDTINKFIIKIDQKQGTAGYPVKIDTSFEVSENVCVIEASLIINATGQPRNVAGQPLFKKLIEHGLAEHNAFGGLNFNTRTQQLFTKNGDTEGLFALGHITMGDRLMPSVSNYLAGHQAQAIAIEVAKKLLIPSVTAWHFSSAMPSSREGNIFKEAATILGEKQDEKGYEIDDHILDLSQGDPASEPLEVVRKELEDALSYEPFGKYRFDVMPHIYRITVLRYIINHGVDYKILVAAGKIAKIYTDLSKLQENINTIDRLLNDPDLIGKNLFLAHYYHIVKDEQHVPVLHEAGKTYDKTTLINNIQIINPELDLAIADKKLQNLGLAIRDLYIISGIASCKDGLAQSLRTFKGKYVLSGNGLYQAFSDVPGNSEKRWQILSTTDSEDYKLMPQHIQAWVDENPEKKADVNCVFLADPSNPTGAIYTKAEKQALVKKCREFGFAIVEDGVYGGITTTGASYTPVTELYPESSLAFKSMGKVFSSPGLRIGFAWGSPEIIKNFYERCKNAASFYPTLSAIGASAILEYTPEEYYKANNNLYKERMEFVRKKIVDINVRLGNVNNTFRIELNNPCGGYFMLLTMSFLKDLYFYYEDALGVMKISQVKGSMDISRMFIHYLDENKISKGVRLPPTTSQMVPDTMLQVRISVGRDSLEVLNEGLNRIEEVIFGTLANQKKFTSQQAVVTHSITKSSSSLAQSSASYFYNKEKSTSNNKTPIEYSRTSNSVGSTLSSFTA